jgi:hypothetical protein
MARGYGFEPGERYMLDGVGYEIVSELSGEEVVVRNLFTRWSAKRGSSAIEGLLGTRGVCGLGSGQEAKEKGRWRCQRIGKWWT